MLIGKSLEVYIVYVAQNYHLTNDFADYSSALSTKSRKRGGPYSVHDIFVVNVVCKRLILFSDQNTFLSCLFASFAFTLCSTYRIVASSHPVWPSFLRLKRKAAPNFHSNRSALSAGLAASQCVLLYEDQSL